MLVPFRTNEEIEREATRFLAQYNPNNTIPVPIEEIVEFDISINIFPLPRLRDRTDVEGFISSDLQTLFVDEDVMKRVPKRYRFTLAHEIAHRYLHVDYIASTTVNTPDEWKTINANRPPEEHRKLEYQANEFAGRILVPSPALSHLLVIISTRLSEEGTDISNLPLSSIDKIYRVMAEEFQVSSEVIKRRLRREGYIIDDIWQ